MAEKYKKLNSSSEKRLHEGKIRFEPALKISIALVFLLTGSYMYFFGNYVFSYQESLILFVFSGDYLHQFTGKPGGLLEFLANLLAQGYFSPVYGSVLLAIINSLFAYFFIKIYLILSRGKRFSMFLVMIPSCMLLLMQTNFNWPLRLNIGLLLTVIYYFIIISNTNSRKHIFSLLFLPLFYYLAGSMTWIFLGMYSFYCLTRMIGPNRFVYPAAALLLGFLSYFVSREILFLQPKAILLLFPFYLKESFHHMIIFYLLIGFIIILPFIIRMTSGKHTIFFINNENTRNIFPVIAVVGITVFFLAYFFKPLDSKLFQMEEFVHEQNWDMVIEYQEKFQISNSVAEYFYCLALSEKGQLCDRLFYSRQDFGPRSLIIPWDSKVGVNNISRGGYFFYSAGLINEAHRWAFESMVSQGFRPENIKMLIKTDLINGHYRAAQKYLNVLKCTFHYRKWAKKYEKMIDSPDLIKADPELGKKIKIMPKKDFPINIRNPEMNLIRLLDANPSNKAAFEYLMAWFLLDRNIDAICREVERIKYLPYKKLPKHIEEALMINSFGVGRKPDVGNLKISDATIDLYRKYELTVGLLPASTLTSKNRLAEIFKNTFWEYFDKQNRGEFPGL